MSTSDVAVSVEQPPPMLARRRPAAGGTLGRYILVRALLIIPTVLILVTLVFFLIRLTGDPITAALGGRLPGGPARRSASTRPATTGRSSCSTSSTWVRSSPATSARPSPTTGSVTEVLVTYGTATLELVVYALLIAFIVGIPLGMVAAAKRDRAPDAALRVSAILFYATPVFFAGLVAKLVFSVWLGWFPVSGRASVRTEIALNREGGTGIYLIDAIALRQPRLRAGRAHARRAARHDARPR